MSEEIKKTGEAVVDLQSLFDEINKLKEQIAKNETKKVNNGEYDFDQDRRVGIIGLYDFSDGLFNIFTAGNRTFKFNKLGQRTTVRFSEFEEIITSNRVLFEQGLLTVSNEDNDIADYFELPKVNKDFTKIEFFNNIVNKNSDEITKIYNSVCDAQKALIIAKWTSGYYGLQNGVPNTNPGYGDRAKIELLDKLSSNANGIGMMKNILDDIDDKRKHGIIK